eukprot:GHVU01067441.1.p1 GENE.GHVU01067441.1~~GHVU01067441.1.p1  ORF type:complete len:368 (-),score=41.36 GHVU01067441.1:91-1194(-)
MSAAVEVDNELKRPRPEGEEESTSKEYVPLKIRRRIMQKALQAKLEPPKPAAEEETEIEDLPMARKEHPKKSLLATSYRIRQEAEKNSAGEHEKKLMELKAEEERILAQVQQSLNTPLMSVKERAKGIVYTERMKSIWKPPQKYLRLTELEAEEIRSDAYIDVSGKDVPPPIPNFEDMRFPRPILEALKERGINRPTQIQMQGIPTILMGRDLVGIAFTGSGKTLVFALPMVMFSLEAHLRCPFLPGEGPFGLCVCPSRELATQTVAVIDNFAKYLADGRYPLLNTVLLIGGIHISEQVRLSVFPISRISSSYLPASSSCVCAICLHVRPSFSQSICFSCRHALMSMCLCVRACMRAGVHGRASYVS